MKILKFEKFFKNAEEGPRVSARNTALNENSKKRQ